MKKYDWSAGSEWVWVRNDSGVGSPLYPTEATPELLATLNDCDHNHKTSEEVRRLPTGGDTAVHVCMNHWQTEINFRLTKRAEALAGKTGAVWEVPDWYSLEIVASGCAGLVRTRFDEVMRGGIR